MTCSEAFSPRETEQCPYAGPGQRVYYPFGLRKVGEIVVHPGNAHYSFEQAVQSSKQYLDNFGEVLEVVDNKGTVVFTPS